MEFRAVHIRTLSGWRAAVAGGLVLALLATLVFGFFLLLLPVAIAAGVASLFLSRKRSNALHHARGRGPAVIETDYKVISEGTPGDDKGSPQDGH